MIRTFGVQTIGAAAQPWFVDATTAAIIAQPQNVNNQQAVTTISVASTTKYRVGDYLVLDAGAAAQERVGPIAQILSANTMNVQGVVKAHASAAVISLDIFCFNVSIQLVDGGTGAAYLGTDHTVTNAPGGTAFYELQLAAAGSPPSVWNYTSSINFDGVKSGDGWIAGTSGDKYLATAYVI
jgi:hypothetical protein